MKLEKIKNNKVLLHDIRLPSRKCSLKRCNTKDLWYKYDKTFMESDSNVCVNSNS